jgi:ferritin-like metal-binding protein YciE
MRLESLEHVFIEQLADLHSAERQLVQALPKVAEAASSEELRDAFVEHLEETRSHVQRLEEIFDDLGNGVPDKHCEGMEGLLREGEEVIMAEGDPNARDAALIAAAQRVEHYEIAGYGTARTLADQLGYNESRALLEDTLDEENDADERLTKIATGGIFGTGLNERATR